MHKVVNMMLDLTRIGSETLKVASVPVPLTRIMDDLIRDLEQAATANHFERLREGRTQSLETSSLHIDIARDLKRIAAHIASVAYPILEQSGALRRTRLLDQAAGASLGR